MKIGTILVVDDEPAVRKVVARLLAEIAPEWTVGQAADLSQATKKLLELQPKLVIVDLHLPDGSGVELCRMVQGHPWLSATRVLAITGRPSDRIREKTFAQGACEFLSKPFEIGELAASVGRLLP